MTHVVWLINNLTHYHRARADTFAKAWHGKFTVLELSNNDTLAVLQSKAGGVAQTATLFPGAGIQQIKKSTLRQSMLRFLDEVNPDVCCLNGWALPGTAVMLDWAMRHAVPSVLMSDSNQHDAERSWWKEGIKRQFLSRCGAALVAGTLSQDYIIKLGMPRECIFDGYDVVDNEHFRAGAKRARLHSQSTRSSLNLPSEYFLACSRFDPVKNLRRLIEGYGAYSRRVGDNLWKLLIVGDGPSRDNLESLARDLNLEQDVLFKGTAEYEQLPGIYGLANAFVHASTRETWGLVVNEAMAAGLPLLVSESCGCVSDLVKDGINGFTFSPWKTDEIAGKMFMMHQDSSRRQRMGQESAAIINNWGPERFALNLGGAVECALSRPRRKRALASRAIVRLMAVR